MELKSEVDAIGINLARNRIQFFLNLEKYHASYNTIRKVIHNAPEVTDLKKIITFFRFMRRLQNDSKKLLEFLKDILILSLTGEQKKICEGKLMGKKIYQSLISMENSKPSGNDGLTEEFYCIFWNEIKNI